MLAATARIDGENFRVAHRKGNIPFWEVEGREFHWRFFHFVNIGDGSYVRLELCACKTEEGEKENKNNHIEGLWLES